jgi:hypothetical protein
MTAFHDLELTDAQMEALCADTHIITSDPSATQTTVRTAWVMFNGRRYVATVYSAEAAYAMFQRPVVLNERGRAVYGPPRATEARITRAYRHPITEEN